MSRKALLLAAFVLAGLLLAAFMVFGRDGGNAALQVETQAAQVQDISRTVSATGSIAPLVEVEVGSQLSGQLIELNADFNDTVEAGQLIARLDPQTFETRVRELRASLEVAQAQVEVAQANLTSAQARAREADRAFDRAVELLDRGTYAQAQFDPAETERDSAQAGILVARADLRNAQASVAQREAQLESAEVDLRRTDIRSPIDGVIVDRQVDVGQTVAASLNAPVLFLIAQDLSRIQIEALVDESDIGEIAPGQPVSFQVDAHPGREFTGEVAQVRLAADEAATVVTYTVVIEADNPGGRLLPNMTANVSIITGEVSDALTVPTQALRFQPRGAAESLVAEGEGAETAQGPRGGGGRGGEMIDGLLNRLELEGETRDQAREALQDSFANMRRQAQGGGGPPDMRGTMRRALADVLDADQIARLDAVLSQGPGADGGEDRPQRGTVWIRDEAGRLRSRAVMIGLSDGARTEIVGGQIEDGDEVVIRVREAAA